MSEFDDSALLHAERPYDPAKARAYYLRTRKLKGRQSGATTVQPASKPQGTQSPQPSQRRSPSGSKASTSKRSELAEQKAALEKRLDRLREVLASLVDAAKKRSGVETKSSKDTTSPETKSPNKPLTAKQKREKADAAREAYEPDTTVSQEVKQLQEQVQDVMSQIKAAAADAQRQRSSQSKPQTAQDRR